MAYSYVNYDGDGEQVNFSVPYLYLLKAHVLVYVSGILKTVDVHYTWLNDSVIQFDTAPGDGLIVSIVRSSGRDARLVDFQTSSILNEETLDKNSNQLFYLMQEAFDALVSASGEDSAIFSTPGAILDAFHGSITQSQLTGNITQFLGYLASNYSHDAIFEFDEDGDEVYEYGVMGHGTARIVLNEDAIALLVSDSDDNAAAIIVNADAITAVVSDTDDNTAAITVNVDAITAVVSDVGGHTALLALLDDQFFVKLDNNGNVAGFGIYNGETSQFIVNVDEFAIIKADGTGDIQVPFMIDATSGLVGIDGNLIVTGSIIAASIGADVIEATHMAVDSILAASIAAGEVDTVHLAADCITAVQIDALAVEAGHINADAVTATEIDVSTLSALAADLGTITAGNITLNTSGFIRTSGKDNYADDTAGFFFGYDGGLTEYVLNLGDATNALKWDGSQLIYAGTIAGVTAGDYIEASSDATAYVINATYAIRKECVIGRSGTWRITFDHKVNNGALVAYARVYKNGSPYGTEWSDGTGVYVERSEDLAFEAGDLCQVYLKGAGAGEPGRSYMRYMQVFCNNPIVTAFSLD